MRDVRDKIDAAVHARFAETRGRVIETPRRTRAKIIAAVSGVTLAATCALYNFWPKSEATDDAFGGKQDRGVADQSAERPVIPQGSEGVPPTAVQSSGALVCRLSAYDSAPGGTANRPNVALNLEVTGGGKELKIVGKEVRNGDLIPGGAEATITDYRGPGDYDVIATVPGDTGQLMGFYAEDGAGNSDLCGVLGNDGAPVGMPDGQAPAHLPQ